eukprot:UN07009
MKKNTNKIIQIKNTNKIIQTNEMKKNTNTMNVNELKTLIATSQQFYSDIHPNRISLIIAEFCLLPSFKKEESPCVETCFDQEIMNMEREDIINMDKTELQSMIKRFQEDFDNIVCSIIAGYMDRSMIYVYTRDEETHVLIRRKYLKTSRYLCDILEKNPEQEKIIIRRTGCNSLTIKLFAEYLNQKGDEGSNRVEDKQEWDVEFIKSVKILSCMCELNR